MVEEEEDINSYSQCRFEPPSDEINAVLEKQRYKVIKKPYPQTTIRQRIAESYNDYIKNIEIKYKMNSLMAWFQLSGSFSFRDELYWVFPYSELQKNIMINYPIETDVKIHVIWYEEDWTSNHSVWDDYLTQDCDTYTLKNVNNWKDLFIKVIQYYKKNRYTIDYCDGHNDKLILCGIEKIKYEHLEKGFKKKINDNDYIVRLITRE